MTDVARNLVETFLVECVVYLIVDAIGRSNLRRCGTFQAKRKVLAAEGCFFLLAAFVAILGGRIPFVMLLMAVGCLMTSASSYGEIHKAIERPFLRNVKKPPVNALRNPHRPEREKSNDSTRVQSSDRSLGLGAEYTEQPLARPPLRNKNVQLQNSPFVGSPSRQRLIETPSRLQGHSSVMRPAPHNTLSPLIGTQEKKSPVKRSRPYNYYTSSVWSIPWWQRFGFSAFISYKGNHPPGIANRSTNTCFLNSCLQCISRSPGFVNSISQKQFSQDTGESVVCSLYKLMEQMVLPKESWRIGHLCNTSFRRAAHSVRPDFIALPDAYQQQNDAGEFLIWLLDTVHEALKTPCFDVNEKLDGMINFSDQLMISQLCLSLQNGHKCSENTLNSLIDACNLHLSSLVQDSASYCLALQLLAASEWALYSKRNKSVVNLFIGQLLEMRQCLNCGRVSASAETFTLLPVPVSRQPGHLMDCLRRFGRTEQLGPQGKMRCLCDTESGSSGNSGSGERKALFSVLPDCLNIQLQRFSYNIDDGIVEKDHTPIDFPLYNLDLASFTLESFIQPGSTQPCLYNLYGVCVHLGSHSASCGHYIAYSLCDEDGKWYKFDDEYVQETDMIQEKSGTTLRENAYLLFYRKIQNIEANLLYNSVP